MGHQDHHDIVVIGGSAGAIEILMRMAEALPEDLPAAIFIVQHVSERSVLPQLLDRVGTLRASHAKDLEAIEIGHIYIAPPDRHLYLEPGVVRVVAGPKENGHRPSVDVLFRSAARAYGARVIGVVLSGALDCGSAGLLAIRRWGGITVVQDPAQSFYPEMPRNALAHGPADHLIRPIDLAPTISRLTRLPAARLVSPGSVPPPAVNRVPSPFTCPECHGTLFEPAAGDIYFRCRVGHAFGESGLVNAQANAVEAALWAGLRALEEHAALNRRLAEGAGDRGQIKTSARFGERADAAVQQAALLRELLTRNEGLIPEPQPELDED